MSKVRMGFVGAGFMGQLAHISNYSVMPEVEMVALADARTKTAEEVARRYGIEQVYSDHLAMLEDADLDAVVAVTNFEFHHNFVPDILKRGLHCLTEKPICVRAGTARELMALAKEAEVVYHIAYMKRCDPASVRMKAQIEEWKRTGDVGKLKYLRIDMPPGDWIYEIGRPIDCRDPFPDFPHEPVPDWMAPETGKRYLAFINYFVHQINFMRYLLGEDFRMRYVDPSDVVLVAESDSGVPIVLEMNAYEVQYEWDETCLVCFENGKLELSLPAPLARQRVGELTIYRGSGPAPVYEKPVFPVRWEMGEQARMFVESILKGTPCISPAEDAVKDLEVSEEYIRMTLEGSR